MPFRTMCFWGLLYFAVWHVPVAPAAESDPFDQATESEVDQAIERGIQVLRTGVEHYPEHRSCFSCHHQALPLLALSTQVDYRDRNSVDALYNHPTTKSIFAFTQNAFESKHQTMREGGEIGGRALTVGYGLWTMDLTGAAPSETTTAMVEYLLKAQGDDGAWNFHSFRPPASSSRAMASAIAIYGLSSYGPETTSPEILQAAFSRAREWLQNNATPESHEDLVGMIWADYMLQQGKTDPASRDRLFGRIQMLIDSQHADGGWSQTSDLPSDAYATGQALVLLAQVEYSNDKKPIHRQPLFSHGVSFLLDTQEDDGSWHVVTRSKPVQVFFDNGDPHGKDQFISMMGTSWATAALITSKTQNHSPLESLRVLRRNAPFSNQ